MQRTPHQHGNYLRALTLQQYEIICLNKLSLKVTLKIMVSWTFQAFSYTDITPENVIFNILLQLQAKRSAGNLLNPVQSSTPSSIKP